MIKGHGFNLSGKPRINRRLRLVRGGRRAAYRPPSGGSFTLHDFSLIRSAKLNKEKKLKKIKTEQTLGCDHAQRYTKEDRQGNKGDWDTREPDRGRQIFLNGSGGLMRKLLSHFAK
jgi:hypothetical protein